MSERKQCWACLKRRLVCDQTRPACTKCFTRGVTCPGYDHKPLKWIAPGQTRSKRRGVRSEKSTDDTCRSEDEGGAERQLVVSPSIDLSSKTTSLFDAVQYYMLATGMRGAHNPFFTPLSAVSDLPAPIKEAMISTALGHRILQSRDERPSEETTILATRLQKHRGAAIRLLADALTQPQTQTSDALIVSIFVFLLAEIQQSISTSWRQHLDGATAIIQRRGGLPNLIISRPLFRNLLQYFVLIDIIGSTTSPVVELDCATRNLELVSLLPLLFGNGLETCVPCPPELFASIIAINHQRACLQEDQHEGDGRFAAGLALLQQILSFSPRNWAANIRMSTLKGAGRQTQSVASRCLDSASPRGLATWDWQRIAAIYQAAIALYCISSLLGAEVANSMEPLASTTYRDTCVGINAMRIEYCSSLMQHLQFLAADAKSQLRKVTIWPLLIAGIEIDPSDEASRQFIEAELGWYSRTLGISSTIIGKQFLNRLWASPVSWHQRKGQTWGALFDRPYIFAI